MIKGAKSPYSFLDGDVLIDKKGNVYVVQMPTASGGYILFEPSTGGFYVEEDMFGYRYLRDNFIECIKRFLMKI